MPAFAWLSVTSAALRAASLNLCTDEYLLLLGRPDEIVSVSHLGKNPRESVLWRRASRLPANRGTVDDVLEHRPNLLLMMGGSGRSSAAIARRLGIRVLDLPYPMTVQDIAHQAAQVASAIGDPDRAAPFVKQIASLQRSRPMTGTDAAYLGIGGVSLDSRSLGADWMRLAGLRQRQLPGGRLTLEMLTTAPPRLLLRSQYRGSQWSRGAEWLQHPIVRSMASRTIPVDGRAWTCAGLPMISEVLRLRRDLR